MNQPSIQRTASLAHVSTAPAPQVEYLLKAQASETLWMLNDRFSICYLKQQPRCNVPPSMLLEGREGSFQLGSGAAASLLQANLVVSFNDVFMQFASQQDLS